MQPPGMAVPAVPGHWHRLPGGGAVADLRAEAHRGRRGPQAGQPGGAEQERFHVNVDFPGISLHNRSRMNTEGLEKYAVHYAARENRLERGP